jgi:methylated-DNA-[protein]-cysteine S-methyltransferase
MTELWCDEIPSPLGTILVVAGERGLWALAFDEQRARVTALLERRGGDIRLAAGDDPLGCRSAVRSYFGGRRDAFEGIPVDAAGGTFEREVWTALREIPFGRTTTYGELARTIGRPGAARAVGSAAGRNPVAIAVPCHRLVATSGLGGYAGGLPRKRWLLEHERAISLRSAGAVGVAAIF